MRLSQFELDSIKSIFKSVFDEGKLYLFGSRIDDSQDGGDIDIYIDTSVKNKVRKKIDFLVKLKNKIGDQKIDIVLSYDKSKPIEQEALKNGILIV